MGGIGFLVSSGDTEYLKPKIKKEQTMIYILLYGNCQLNLI